VSTADSILVILVFQTNTWQKNLITGDISKGSQPVTHTHTLTLMHSHTLTHTRTLTYTHTLTHTHIHSHTLTLTHTHIHSHTLTLTHTHIHSLTHSHTLTLTHTHSHTHTHMHTRLSVPILDSLLHLLSSIRNPPNLAPSSLRSGQ